MIHSIARLASALRQRGVPVSTAEEIDAARAMSAVGVERRERLKVALRATLAKGPAEREAFDELFEGLFAAPRPQGPGKGRRAGGGAEGGHPGQGGGGEGRPGGRQARGQRVPGASVARPHERRPAPRPGTVLRVPARIHSSAGREAHFVEKARRGRLRRIVALRPRSANGPALPDRAHQRDGAPSGGRTGDILGRPLASEMGAEEERELCDMIPRIVEQIRLRRGRRLREGSAGRVWMRGAFRESVRHGGVPFVLPLRERKLRRPRVVLLVDVSYSVIRCAGLFLLIALSFLRRHRSTRVVVFVDRAVEATGEMLSWARGRRAPEAPGASPITGPWRSRTWPGRRPVRPHLRGPAAAFRRGQFPGDGIRPAGGVSFMELLSRLPDLNLEAPSDYGRAFHGLGRRIRFGGRDTVLVVLGDGRTNRFDPLDWAFRDIADRCGRVIWLVPEERGRWGTGDSSLPAYLAHSDVAVETRDLSGLRRGVLEVLRGL